jgi:hypothetical protein
MSVGRQIGFAQRVWRATFGAPDEAEQALKEATSHGASLINLARAWSVPLLICFSIAAAIVLGRAPMEHNIALAQTGFGEGGALGAVMALNWFEMIELLVIIVFVFGADLAVLAAANNFRDGRSRGEKVSALFGHTVIIFGIGALEACTFTIMLASIENPQTLAQWAFVLFRSIGIPTVAVYLATLRRRRLTEDDSDALMEMKTSKRLIALIDSVDMEHADIGQLMNLRMLLAAKHLSKERRAEAIIEAINRLSPDVARVELEAERAHLREAIANANTRAFQQLSSALLHLAATGNLPDWVIEQAPELAGLKFGSLGRAGGNRGTKAPASEPRSRSDAARFWLNAIGVTPGKTPVGRKGIWLKSSDLSAITDGRMSGEAATNMAKILGENTKISPAYALPFERAMSDLYQRQMLTDDARKWWESFVATGGNEGENASTLRAV